MRNGLGATVTGPTKKLPKLCSKSHKVEGHSEGH
jgi:hypothetical protein